MKYTRSLIMVMVSAVLAWLSYVVNPTEYQAVWQAVVKNVTTFINDPGTHHVASIVLVALAVICLILGLIFMPRGQEITKPVMRREPTS